MTDATTTSRDADLAGEGEGGGVMPDYSDLMGPMMAGMGLPKGVDNGDGTWTYTFKATPPPLRLNVPSGLCFVDAQTGEPVSLPKLVAEMITRAQQAQGKQ